MEQPAIKGYRFRNARLRITHANSQAFAYAYEPSDVELKKMKAWITRNICRVELLLKLFGIKSRCGKQFNERGKFITQKRIIWLVYNIACCPAVGSSFYSLVTWGSGMGKLPDGFYDRDDRASDMIFWLHVNWRISDDELSLRTGIPETMFRESRKYLMSMKPDRLLELFKWAGLGLSDCSMFFEKKTVILPLKS